MATKPTDLPIWATDTTFTNGDYVGEPTKIEPALGKQQEGWIPKEKPAPEIQNWWQNLTYQWCVWVDGGKANFDIDAHIVETDTDGTAKANKAHFETSTNSTTLIASNFHAEGLAASFDRGDNATGGYVVSIYGGSNLTGGPDVGLYIDCQECKAPRALVVEGGTATTSNVLEARGNSTQGFSGLFTTSVTSTSTARGAKIQTLGAAKGLEIDSDGGTGTSLLISGPNANTQTVQINLTHTSASGVLISQPVGFTGYSLNIPCATNGKGIYVEANTQPGIHVDLQSEGGSGLYGTNATSGSSTVLLETGQGVTAYALECVGIDPLAPVAYFENDATSTNTVLDIYGHGSAAAINLYKNGTGQGLWITKEGASGAAILVDSIAATPAIHTKNTCSASNSESLFIDIDNVIDPAVSPLRIQGQTVNPSAPANGGVWFRSDYQRLMYKGGSYGNHQMFSSPGGLALGSTWDDSIANITSTTLDDILTMELDDPYRSTITGPTARVILMAVVNWRSATGSAAKGSFAIYNDVDTNYTHNSTRGYSANSDDWQTTTIIWNDTFETPNQPYVWKLRAAKTDVGSADIVIAHAAFAVVGTY